MTYITPNKCLCRKDSLVLKIILAHLMPHLVSTYVKDNFGMNRYNTVVVEDSKT